MIMNLFDKKKRSILLSSKLSIYDHTCYAPNKNLC